MSASPRQFTRPLLIWGSLLLAGLFSALVVVILQRQDRALELLLDEQLTRDQGILRAALASRHTSVERISQKLASDPHLQQLLASATAPGSTTQMALREQLHHYLQPTLRTLHSLELNQLILHREPRAELLREESNEPTATSATPAQLCWPRYSAWGKAAPACIRPSRGCCCTA